MSYRQPILSLAQISTLEQADALGASAASAAVDALLHRWGNHLRDSETALRLIFLLWYNCADQSFLSDSDEYPSIEAIVSDLGGIDALSPEAAFIIGLLTHSHPYCFGSAPVWENRVHALLQAASAGAPHSRLFRNWQFFVGEQEDTSDPRIYIEPEVHARFHGRGIMGAYLKHILNFRLREGRGSNRPA